MNNSKRKKQKFKSGITKKSRERIIVIAAALLVLLIGGICFEQLRPRVILNINGEKYYRKDMMYEIFMTEMQYDNIDSMYQQSYGKSYWDSKDNSGMTGREEARNKIVQAVSKREVLYQAAKKDGLTLTDTEKAEVDKQVKEVRAKMNDHQKTMDGLDEASCKTALEKEALGKKYQEKKEAAYSVDEEAVKKTVDQKANKQYDLEYYFGATQKKNSEDKMVDVSADDMAKMKKSMEDLSTKAKKAKDFSKLLKSDDKSGITYDTRKMLGSSLDFLTDKERDKIMKMQPGEISELFKVTTGYYLVKLVDNTSTEGFDNAVKEALIADRTRQFNAEYSKMIKDDYKIKIGTDNWNQINVGNVTI